MKNIIAIVMISVVLFSGIALVQAKQDKSKDNKKIDELEKRFNATLRKSERYEGFPVRSLSHSNESEKD
ncbi:MAG: hypothetical protein KAI17_13015 [Thiotrichaceae bacterium]|nr:hypothetical protein [Thiotrichaceae bacterium]